VNGYQRAIFLDVDGTYALHGRVPPAHAAAVCTAREAGHKVFLCTGRPVSALTHHLIEAGFDGFVASAGAYVEIEGEVIADERFPSWLAKRLLEELDENSVAYIVENAEELFLPRRYQHLLPRALKAYGGEESDVIIEIADSFDDITFAKVICFGRGLPLRQILSPLGTAVSSVPNSIPDLGGGAGEVYQTHITKAVGIQKAIDALGMTPAQVVAYGDGINDIEMLQFAATSVAVEGSDPRVLAAAQHRAAGPEFSGLAVSFLELGLTRKVPTL
jgi:Cof subfamily protein (haloacid dehalogenase superfamily)